VTRVEIATKVLKGSGVDVDGLRSLYSAGRVANPLLAHFATRVRDSKVTKLVRARDLLVEHNPLVPYPQIPVTTLFEQLEKLGCGRLRHSEGTFIPLAFEWHVSLIDVGLVATSPDYRVGKARHEADRATLHGSFSPPASPRVLPDGSRVEQLAAYCLWLRPSSPAFLSLPSDLTVAEANQVAEFVRLLPQAPAS
jgi:hypothetical protein